MLYIKNESNDPYYNMALDEFVVRHLDPTNDYFYFYQNKPTVVIGKNQNTIEEVNSEYVKQHDITVVRRMSGGGAVYHDLGNINFSFVVDYRKEDFNSLERFAKAIIKALEKLGVKAQFSGRNDIVLDGKKFSGNAQYLSRGRLLHHGTLLFDSDLTILTKALKVKDDKISSKGIKSVKSRVTNLKDYFKEDICAEDFKELLLRYVFEVEDNVLKEYVLTSQDLKNIKQLRDEKYSTWEWNYGFSPKFDLTCSKRFPGGGEVEINLNVQDGKIADIKFYGDFMSKKDVSQVEESLVGIRLKKDDVSKVLSKFNLKEYFGTISLEELISLFI